MLLQMYMQMFLEVSIIFISVDKILLDFFLEFLAQFGKHFKLRRLYSQK